jgi:RNA polymerase sigma-54 factor
MNKPYPLSLNLQVKQAAHLKQTQRLIMSPQMQQAIRLLQMPILELSTALEEELQQNPVIDFIEQNEDENSTLKKLEDENDEEDQEKEQKPEQELSFNDYDFEILKKLDEEFRDHFSDYSSYAASKTTDDEKLKTFQESSICSETSLFEFLMLQARETFSDPEELAMAEAIIGSFDENGFLKTPFSEIALLYNFSTKKLGSVLKEIQSFEPYGIGAANMQESLLIQLRCQHKHKTLAYKIIENHYEDLLHNRIPVIKKSLECSAEEISTVLKKDISRLDLHPGFGHFKHFVQYIIPDAVVEIENDQLTVKVNDDFLPPIRINRRYLRMLEDQNLPGETREFIQNKWAAVKWLLRTVHQRNETLLKIVELLTKLQKEYFLNPEGKLLPLTMKAIAEELKLHESTIARAVANKYIDTPRGILPLRAFFTQALITEKGEDISSNTVKTHLRDFVQNEDKEHPLSDADLSQLLEEQGIHCARRTVAKYRAELNLGNAQQRKKY